MIIRTKLDKNMQKELSKMLIILSYVSLAIGAVWFLAYVIGTMIGHKFDYRFLWGMFFLVLPIFLIFNFKKSVMALGDGTKENEYEFFDDYFTATTYYHNENIGTMKVQYSDIYKTRETKNYIFVFINYGSALPISKAGLGEEVLQKIRECLNVKPKRR